MRLNRNTLILLIVSVVVIAAVWMVNNNSTSQTAAPTATPESGGPLFPDVTADQVLSLAIRSSATDAFVRISRESTDAEWQVTGPENAADQVVDQIKATEAVNNFIGLASVSNFAAESLAEFGLDAPQYVIEVDTGAETLDVILVGSKNPSGNRYYVIPQQVAPEATAEVADSGETVYLVASNALDLLIDLISQPPYQPTATPLPTATPTLNPMSEVEMATATAGAQATMDALLATAQAEAEATAEATGESTPEVTAEATEEAE